MAVLHSFVVIGVMAGYIVGAISVNVLEEYMNWRFAFQLQGYFMILIGICFLCSDNEALDIFVKLKDLKERSPFELNKDSRVDPNASH